MTLSVILILSLIAFLAGWLSPARWRVWVLLSLSLLAIYWLQPSSPIRHLDFWLPGLSIFLTVFCWAILRSKALENKTTTALAITLIISSILLVGVLRYFPNICCITPTRPPSLLLIIIGLGLAAVLVAIPYRFTSTSRWLSYGAIFVLLAILVALKSEFVAKQASLFLRLQTGQSVELASALDLPWLGYSYLAFRLIHALRDFQAGKLPNYTLGEFATYALFFPAYPAGPIDRSQHFINELRIPSRSIPAAAKEGDNPGQTGRPKLRLIQPDYENVLAGGQRILIGVFQKFVLADSLALIALNQQNASQVTSPFWMWILLYAFALRIYFDFAGYTNIAIGIGRFMQINLPENFTAPYLKQNLTAFWNSWHITLAQWFRAYYFNPLTRTLRSRQPRLPIWITIFIGQVSTMVLIGLWHGITWNFALWGLWHGLGLFFHNRWAEWSRPHLQKLEARPLIRGSLQFGGWLLTFNYVALGWVWFALPNPNLSRLVFQKLLGL